MGVLGDEEVIGMRTHSWKSGYGVEWRMTI